MSITAYKRTISQTENPRQIERRVISSVTAALEDQYLEFDQAEKPADRLRILSNGLRDTITRNQKVWQTLRLDLVQPGNGLSPDLKAGLISLATWVESHSIQVLGGNAKVRPLLDINKTIVRGLEGNPMRVAE